MDAIFDAFPEGIFGLRGGLDVARVAGHGSSSWPPGLSQIDLDFEGVRVRTARDHGLPTSLVVNELVFHWLTEADLTFPLTLRIERYEHSLPVDTVSTAFDTYVLGGEIVAIACVSDVRVTVRCHEDVLGTLQLARLSRSEVEQLAGRADS